MNRTNQYVALGSTDLQVSRLGYGAARIDTLPPDQTEILLNALVDEGITSSLMLSVMTAGAPRHDMITLTGGAIRAPR